MVGVERLDLFHNGHSDIAVFPPTAVLGTVLLTGYLGGAISAYVRLGEPYPMMVPLTTALLAWAGIYLREERLRSLLPFRRKAAR